MFAWSKPDVPRLLPSAGITDRLQLHDTATGAPVAVDPASDKARLYVCGITPYDATHLGHANTYLAFDTINRIWRDLGFEVEYTQNVTDVDDPLLERAQQLGLDWEELAEDQIELFRSDMQDLRVIPPTHYVGAVESISLVTELLERLLPTGLIYQIADAEHPDWYFNCAAATGFGQVSNLEPGVMLEQFAERGGDPERSGKRDRLDCLLWRFARPGEPSWSSPLGAGRPGWHIECTAIALHYLGQRFDVQGGGSDLIFPHHEMCAAQALAVTNQPLASAFVHSGMVGLDGEKMSKSKGNLELVSRLRQGGADPMAIRLALLAHHYRSDWEWSPEQLVTATDRLNAWREVARQGIAAPAAEPIAQLRQALRTDLNTPAALKVVDDWVASSQAANQADTAATAQFVTVIDALLGIAL